MKVAVLGATGAVGQRFIQRLDGHPDFDIAALVASDRSSGHGYREVCTWILDGDVPDAVADMPVISLGDLQGTGARLGFSALPSGQAGEVERRLTRDGLHVFTNASAHRMDPDVPLLIPEVNADHVELLTTQQAPGKLVANGNCSGIILTMALAPLHRAFGLKRVDVATMQGLSGAGYPGVSGLDVIDNIVPYIGGEEDKLETEPQKTLGTPTEAADFTIRATCTRVPVREGHFEVVHARLDGKAEAADIKRAWEDFRGTDVAGLHSAPDRPIVYRSEVDRPQPRRDRDEAGGMAVTVGRLRVDGPDIRFVVLGHNTVRGAAGQSVLNAEYALAQGLL